MKMNKSKKMNAHNNYMLPSLAPSLPSFHGNPTENIKYYIKQFNDIANLEKWNEEKRRILFKLNMKEKALEFMVNDNFAANCESIDALQKLMLQKFGKSESFEDLQNNFDNLSHTPGQSVANLADTVSKLAQKLFNQQNSQSQDIKNLTERLQKKKFIDILRPDIRIEVNKQGPQSFAEAVKIAKNIEKALNIENANSTANYNLELNAIVQENLKNQLQIAKLNSELENLKTNSMNNIRAIPSTSAESNNHESQEKAVKRVFCHICGKPHLTTKCWYFPSKDNNNQKYNQRGYHRGNTRQNRNFPYHRRNGFDKFNNRNNLN